MNLADYKLETWLLLIGIVMMIIQLAIWHRDDTEFDLRHILIDSKTKRVSLMKIGQATALILSSWVLIYETRNDRLTEWLFLSFMGVWSGANLAKRWIDKDKKE